MLKIARMKLILLLILATCSYSKALKTQIEPENSNLKKDIIIRINNGTFGTKYEFSVNEAVEYTFKFMNVTKLLFNRTARIVVETLNATNSNPVLIVVRQKKDVMSWQHPLIVSTRMSDSAEYEKVSRTICPSRYYQSSSPGSAEDDEEILLVTASTASPSNISVKLQAVLMDDFYLSLSKEKKIMASPSEPSFYGYLFSHDEETVLLTAHSEDDACTIISVQNIDCPIYDLENTVKFEGQWETMMHKGGMTIKRNENQTGFFVVFVVNSRDDECTEKRDRGFENGNTKITFKLVPEISGNQYLLATLLPFFLCMFLYLVCGVKMYRKYRNTPLTVNVTVNENSNQEDLGRENLGHQQPSTSTSDVDRNDRSKPNHKAAMETQSCEAAARASRKKSHLYVWITILAGIFFFVPAIQRVLTHQAILQETGNYDLCFYNYHCAHPLPGLNLIDFNHIYSNIGYILLGILFLAITIFEKKYFTKIHCSQKVSKIPHEFGLYYAMGVSLIAEGCLSATYHVCPRGSNFQFDTTFMYVTALLCMVNIYQNWNQYHYANATSIFLFLGFVTILVMLGNVLPVLYLSIFIGVCQILVSFLISLQLYYNEKISLGFSNTKDVFCKWIRGCCKCKKPSFSIKLALILFVNVINWVLAFLGIFHLLGGVANIVLAVFIGNLFLPFALHILIKHQDVKNKVIIKIQDTPEPAVAEESTQILKKVASDIAVGASTLTIGTESTDLSESEIHQNPSATDEMTADVDVRKAERSSKVYWNLICCKMFEPNFYFTLTILFWFPALYFFFSNTSSWEDTPAMSRNKNQPCRILDFYDNHDIWHFLSAGGLFFSLMVFLSLNNHRLDTL